MPSARNDENHDAPSATARRRALLALPVCLLLPVTVARAADADRPLVLGTSTPGGGFSLYGETLQRVLERRAGRAIVRVRETRGSAENLELLAQNEIDAALIQGTSASELFERTGASDLRVLFAMYPSPGMLCVPAPSTIARLADVRGRPVVFGVRTSGLVTLGRQVFAGIGIDIDRDVRAIYVDRAVDAPPIVVAGDAVGLWGAGEGWPGFVTLARASGGARFIGPTAEEIPRIVARYPLLQPMEVAPGAYPGIDRPLPTVGSVNFILTRADLDDRRAAMFVQAMRDAAAELAEALPQAAFSTLANTVASVPSPQWLHRAVLAAR
jgi:uncharacterized protein